jgi:uncharacterized membrane protein
MRPHAFVRILYLALMALQVVWHGLLPEPSGNRNWLIALAAAVPLVFPLPGILAGRIRSMTWGGYLLVIYFTAGVMEVWSNPPQRLPAVLQVVLVLLYVAALVWLARRDKMAP